MKTFVKWILLGTSAVIISMLSMNIQTGTDNSESETIGIQKKCGFPISYQTKASGLAWAKYDPIRFGLNTVTWILFVGVTVAGLKRIKKIGSNNG